MRLTGLVLRVGLTGGIGAGKSAVAARLGALGAIVIDSDVLAREVVAPGTEGLTEVVNAFGDGVLGPSGALDRPALARIVFGDDAARRRLEQIIHPLVRARTAALTAAAPAEAIVVNDVPLLVEVGLAPTYHLVIVVEAARSLRVRRLVQDRGMAAEQALARIEAQAADPVRRAAADVLLRNDGSKEELAESVEQLWQGRLLAYERNVRSRTPALRPGPERLVKPDPQWSTQFNRLAARIRRAVGDLPVEHIGSTAVPGLASRDLLDLQLAVASPAQIDTVTETLAEAGFPPMPGSWQGVVDAAGPEVPGSGAAGPGAVGSGAVGSGAVGSGAVGSGAVGSGAVGSGAPGSGAPGSGAPGSGAVGSGAVGSGAVGSGAAHAHGLVAGWRPHGSADPARPVYLHVLAGGSPGWRFALLMRDFLRAEVAEREAYLALKVRLTTGPADPASYPAAKLAWWKAASPRAEDWAARTGWTVPT